LEDILFQPVLSGSGPIGRQIEAQDAPDLLFEALDSLRNSDDSETTEVALDVLGHLSHDFPTSFFGVPFVPVFVELISIVSDDQLSGLLDTLSSVLAHRDCPPELSLSVLDGKFLLEMHQRWDLSCVTHLYFLQFFIYTLGPDHLPIFIDFVLPIVTQFEVAGPDVRLLAISCLSLLVYDSDNLGLAVEHGIFATIEASLVVTTPQLFAETFLLINSLIQGSVPPEFLTGEFFSRFRFFWGQLNQRGSQLVLTFLRLVAIQRAECLFENGIVADLIEHHVEFPYVSRRLTALLFLELFDFLCLPHHSNDLVPAVHAIIENCSQFTEECFLRSLHRIDCLLEAGCEEVREHCDMVEFWDTLIELTDSGSEQVADAAQIFLEEHYWPMVDDSPS
jgi:hypothetical protein